jgi:PKD repeat protein
MWGLSPSDNNTQINNYKTQFGITNPCAGTEGGGPQAIAVVNSGQPFYGYPTYIVVCPDRTVYYDVCWPPSSSSCFDPYFQQCGATGIQADFEADFNEICAGQAVTFTDFSVCDITEWQWSFPGGTPETSTEQNPLVIYETPGSFDVELTISKDNITATTAYADFITVNALPSVTLEDFGEVCIEWETFELTGGLPEGGEYSGTGIENGILLTQVAGLGTIAVYYTFTDDNGCENTAETEITITTCVGLDELEIQGISMYPNPSSGIVNIINDTSEPFAAAVFNSNGAKLMKLMIIKTGVINLERFPPGLYYIQFQSETQSGIRKIIVTAE